ESAEAARAAAERARGEEAAARLREEGERSKATEALAQAQNSLYLRRVSLAEREWGANNVARAEQLLGEGPAEQRRWEWPYAKRRCRPELLTFCGHDGPVWAVAFHPDGTRIASAGARGVVKVWAARTGKVLRTLRGHEGGVRGAAFTPDGRRLVTA